MSFLRIQTTQPFIHSSSRESALFIESAMFAFRYSHQCVSDGWWLGRRYSSYLYMADCLEGTTKEKKTSSGVLIIGETIGCVWQSSNAFPSQFQRHSKSASCLPAPTRINSGASYIFADLEQVCVHQWKPKPAELSLMTWGSHSRHQVRKPLSKWYQASKSTFMAGFPQGFLF